ncbi:hypothetical protein, partial [Alloprevotella tannerae]
LRWAKGDHSLRKVARKSSARLVGFCTSIFKVSYRLVPPNHCLVGANDSLVGENIGWAAPNNRRMALQA